MKKISSFFKQKVKKNLKRVILVAYEEKIEKEHFKNCKGNFEIYKFWPFNVIQKVLKKIKFLYYDTKTLLFC